MKNIDMNKFKHYVVVDDATESKAAIFEEFFKSAEEANKAAQESWERLTDYDKRGNRRIYVGYVTINEMNLDWIDEDDDFDYDSPPWNGDSGLDPNGVLLFDSGSVSQAIARARSKKELTQLEVGEALGYEGDSAQVTVARWEAGTRPVPREKILELCKLLDLDPMIFLM